VKKEQNGRKSLRRIKPTVGCIANKRRRRRRRTIHHNMFRLFRSAIIRWVPDTQNNIKEKG